MDQKFYVIRCPGARADNGKSCHIEWPFPLCKKVGVLTKDERMRFEEGFALNYAHGFLKAKNCPTIGCEALLI